MEEVFLFYEAKYDSSKKIIFNLLNIMSLHCSDNDLEEMLVELRELRDIKDCPLEIRVMIDETVKDLSEELHICPICGGELIYNSCFEKHYEIDEGNDIEEMGYYECKLCRYEDK